MAQQQSELLLRVTGDSKGGQQAAQQMASSLEQLANTATGAAQQVADALSGAISEGLPAVADGLAKVTDAVPKESEKAAQESVSIWKQWSSEIEGIGQKTGDEIKKGINDPLQALKDVATGAMDALGPFGTGLTVIGTAATAAGAALFKLSESAAETVDNIGDFATITGLTLKQTSELKYVTDITGESLDKMQGFAMLLERQMMATGKSAERFDSGLQNLGIRSEEFRAAKLPEQIVMLSEGFKRGAADGETMKTVLEVLTRRGMSYVDFLSKDLSAAYDEAGKKALEISEQNTKDAEQFQIAVNRLDTEFKNLKTTLGMELVPAFADLTNSVTGLFGHIINAAPIIAPMIVSMFSPWAAGALLIGEATRELVKWKQEAADAALQKETDAAKQDTVNRAIKLGADSTIQYADAVQYLTNVYKGLTSGPMLDPAEEEARAAARKKAAEEAADAVKRHADALAQETAALQGNKAQYALTLEAVEKLTGQQDLSLDTQRRMVDALNKIKDAGAELPPVLEAWRFEHQTLGAEFRKNAIDADRLTAALGRLRAGAEEVKLQNPSLDAPRFRGKKSGFGAAEVGTLTSRSLEGAIGQSGTSKMFGEFLQGVPGTLVQGLTGGSKEKWSGIAQGLSAQLGSKLGENLGKGIASLGSLGGPMGMAIGGLAGPLIGKLIGSFGPSEKEMGGRKVVADFEQSFGGFNNMMTAVGDAYAKAGKSSQQAQADVKALIDAEKRGPEATQEWLNKIQATMRAAAERTQAIEGGVGKVVQAFRAAGTSIPDSLRTSISDLRNMEGLTEAQRKALDGLLQKGRPNFEQLQGLAANYGITLEGLGPQFAQGRLEDEAKKIFDAFTALKDAGGDAGGILSGMSDEISKLVQDSVKFGTAIPDNMKPLIDNLSKAGKLTDENGDAITDISKLSFEGTPLEESVQTLVDAIKELVDNLNRVPGAAAAAGSAAAAAAGSGGRLADPNRETPLIVEGAYTGAYVTMNGLKRFADGGPADDIIPALLAPGELVLNKSQQRVVGALMSAAGVKDLGGGGGVNLVIQGPMFLRDRAAMQELSYVIAKTLSDRVRLNTPISLR